MIPASAEVYVQLVESTTLHQWHDLSKASAGRCTLEVSRGARSCTAAHSIHAAPLESYLTPLTEPIAAHKFDLANPELSGSGRATMQITASGTAGTRSHCHRSTHSRPRARTPLPLSLSVSLLSLLSLFSPSLSLSLSAHHVHAVWWASVDPPGKRNKSDRHCSCPERDAVPSSIRGPEFTTRPPGI